jgi:diadenosine tetraphosphate (Ap4A) HIT family hydrolase
MNQNCVFCTSAKQEGRILKQGKYAYVILSNPRLMPGHVLVIPERHIDGRLSDLTLEERNEIFDLLAEFQNKILERLTSGCDIRENYKPYVNDSNTHVNHMHFHLLPREAKDELSEVFGKHHTPLYRELPAEEKENLQHLLLN